MVTMAVSQTGEVQGSMRTSLLGLVLELLQLVSARRTSG